jgi:glycerol-3-phosphate acyltransferase PlsY
MFLHLLHVFLLKFSRVPANFACRHAPRCHEDGMAAWTWLWPVFFFLLGSIPTGYLMGRARGIDVRQHGSGNIGATNVGRVLGRNWGLAAFAIDFAKGFVALFLLRVFVFPGIVPWNVQLLLVVCGMAAVLGHNYTPWLGFKGGKGIATSAGVIGALLPEALIIVFGIWACEVLILRYVSLGSVRA